jgi:hypothetical protein
MDGLPATRDHPKAAMGAPMANITTESFRFLRQLLGIGGVAGLIALGIAAAICVRYVQYGNEQIPQVLSYALTTIIGFYFGASVRSSRQQDQP